jgi:hypothetical protein
LGNGLQEPIAGKRYAISQPSYDVLDFLGNAISSVSTLYRPIEPFQTPNTTMASSRIVSRSSRAFAGLQRSNYRSFSISAARNNQFEALNKRTNDTSEQYRKFQMEKNLNPHMTNTTSTIANEMPSVGKDAPPPELITSVDGSFTPKDSVPENTHRMTGGTQSSEGQDVSGKNAELGVGELEGAK